MAYAKICDKCKKIILEDPWESSETYEVADDIRIVINKQTVMLNVNLALACGDPLDLCNKCGWAIIRKKIGKKDGKNKS